MEEVKDPGFLVARGSCVLLGDLDTGLDCIFEVWCFERGAAPRTREPVALGAELEKWSWVLEVIGSSD